MWRKWQGAAWATVLIVALIIVLAEWWGRAGAAPAGMYMHAPNWYVNMNPETCQDATIGGPMAHIAPVQVLIYPVGSSQPVYANVLAGGATFSANVHLGSAMQRWYVVALTYEGAPWLMISEEADCYSGPLRVPK
jgi:hypothetical protein